MVATIGGATGAISEILKRVYDTVLYDSLNSRDDLMADIPKTYDGTGEEFITLNRSRGTSSMRFQSEDSALPARGSQKYYNTTVTPVEWWGTLGISQRAMVLSRNKIGAFLNGFTGEVEGFAKDYRTFMEQTLLGDGSGVYGTTTAASLAHAAGPPAQTTASLSFFYELRNFQPLQEIEFWTGRDAAATLLEGAAGADDVVWTIAENGILTTGGVPKIVFTDPGDVTGAGAGVDRIINTANLSIARAGSRGAFVNGVVGSASTVGTAQEMMGLNGVVLHTDPPLGPLQGVDAQLEFDRITTNAAPEITWEAKFLDNSGVLRPPSEFLLGDAKDMVEIGSTNEVSRYVCGYGTRLQYAVDQLNSHRNVNTISISGENAGGFKENTKSDDFVEYGRVKLHPNRFQPINTVLGLDWSALEIKFWKKPGWWDPDGSVVRRSTDGSTQLWAEQNGFWQLCVKERNCHVRIEDVEGAEKATY